jgi:hypothetical protein
MHNPSGDGQNWVSLDYLYYNAKDGTKYRVGILATTDGPSIPPKLVSLISPFGPINLPAVLHDGLFRSTVQQLIDGVWRAVQLGPDKNDALFDEAMESRKMNSIERLEVFRAVKMFGNAALANDLAQPIITQSKLP